MTEQKKQKTEKVGVEMQHGDPLALVQAWQEAVMLHGQKSKIGEVFAQV